MTVTVRLTNGRVLVVDKVKGDRLVRKNRATYYKTATKTRETAMHRAPEQR